MSIDLDKAWTNIVTRHVMNCDKIRLISDPTWQWKVIRHDKRKFELIEHYKCLGCREVLIKRASKPSLKSDLNVVVSAAMFTSATFPQQAIELFGLLVRGDLEYWR